MWQIPLELKRQLGTIPLICDPSHICGTRDYIFEVSQNAMDLDYDGLIIETHRDPENAWSDAAQQITPEVLSAMLKNIKFRKPTSKDKDFITILGELREQIDHVDKELFEIIAQRMDIVEKMGLYKKKNDVTVFQKDRWQQLSESRTKWAEDLGLNTEFMWDLFKLIHDASIKRQEYIMNTPTEESNVKTK
jgi:chorismate mutase